MRLLVVVLSVFFFFACSERKSSHPITRLQATKINSDLFMGLPVVIKVFPGDSILWISDFSTNHLVSGVHKKTGKVLCRLAQKGNGPLEMTPPVHIFFHDRNLCLYDRNKRKLYRASVDSILTNSKSLHEVASFNNGYNLIYNLTDSTYIGTGFFEKRFSIADSMGRELYQAGELPRYWSGEQGLSDRVRSMYHQAARLCRHPSRPFLAVCTSDVLTAYRVGNNTLDEMFQILLNDYAFDFEEGVFVSAHKRPDVPEGISDVSCDDNYIYALYDPNSHMDSHKVDKEIRVYDWEGELVKTIIPDVNLSVMTLDVAENAIYGIYIEDEPEICRIQL